MKISELNSSEITPRDKELINRLLFDGIEDDGKDGDLIFVFGSLKATKYRVPLAVELYEAKRAPHLFLSGGTLEKPEAVSMREKAMEMGVPAASITIETKSSNTAENVLKSKKILDEQYGLHQLKRILLVTTAYHMRRCCLTFKTHLPPHIEYTLCAANDQDTRKDNWWQSEVGTAR